MIFSVVFTACVLVAPVELPDKTMFATLVLASRFRPLPVLTGVGAAFALQTAIAVAAGSLVSLLPRQWVANGVAMLFAGGAVVLWRSAGDASVAGGARDGWGAGEGGGSTQDEHKTWPAWRIALASFGSRSWRNGATCPSWLRLVLLPVTTLRSLCSSEPSPPCC